ncbi:MAG TPA: hypothetical protein VFC70_03105, partial [Oscillospiraceae bacterium]|nr:hypothetical protein [Oscillospiraceae bacterium]
FFSMYIPWIRQSLNKEIRWQGDAMWQGDALFAIKLPEKLPKGTSQERSSSDFKTPGCVKIVILNAAKNFERLKIQIFRIRSG